MTQAMRCLLPLASSVFGHEPIPAYTVMHMSFIRCCASSCPLCPRLISINPAAHAHRVDSARWVQPLNPLEHFQAGCCSGFSSASRSMAMKNMIDRWTEWLEKDETLNSLDGDRSAVTFKYIERTVRNELDVQGFVLPVRRMVKHALEEGFEPLPAVPSRTKQKGGAEVRVCTFVHFLNMPLAAGASLSRVALVARESSAHRVDGWAPDELCSSRCRDESARLLHRCDAGG